MRESLKLILLGAIQGIAEVFPISSSGHLVILRNLLNFSSTGMSIEILLHFGTFLSIIVYFRKTILDLIFSVRGENKRSRNLLLYVILATIPGAVFGFLFDEKVEVVFSSPEISAMFLVINGLFLLFVSSLRSRKKELNPVKSLIIGLFQSVALLPGISRSGSALGGGIILGISPNDAFQFSFLLAIPITFGALVLELRKAIPVLNPSSIVATLVSFVFGLISLALFSGIVKKGKLFVFGVYSILAGILALIYLIF